MFLEFFYQRLGKLGYCEPLSLQHLAWMIFCFVLFFVLFFLFNLWWVVWIVKFLYLHRKKSFLFFVFFFLREDPTMSFKRASYLFILKEKYYFNFIVQNYILYRDPISCSFSLWICSYGYYGEENFYTIYIVYVRFFFLETLFLMLVLGYLRPFHRKIVN